MAVLKYRLLAWIRACVHSLAISDGEASADVHGSILHGEGFRDGVGFSWNRE